jgi:hypothetical protein
MRQLAVRPVSGSACQILPPSKMIDLHSLPSGSRPDAAVRNNGPDDLALERFKLRELAEGWPSYR